MTRAARRNDTWKGWALFWGFWTLIGLSFAGQFYISSSKLGRPVTWGFAVSYSLGDWYVFAVLSIPVVALSRRCRIGPGKGWRPVAVHLAASSGFAVAYMVLRAAVAQWQGPWSGGALRFVETLNTLAVKTLHFTLLIYWVIVAVQHAFAYYQEAQERHLRAAELEGRLVQARLQALQMQLNPHFLFNTLHGIAALMHQDVDAADRMIIRLSELLRYALESTEAHEVTLKQELSFLERYLEIERARFGPRLSVSQRVDPGVLGASVPNLILQPLVENAIRHGIEPHARPGRIELRAARDGGMLRLEVWDNGDGVGDRPVEHVGLRNTRHRLAQLYGEEQSLEFGRPIEGGTVVRIQLPFRAGNGPEVAERAYEITDVDRR